MNFPENLKYTKEHIWVAVAGTEATIGITDFAQSELGDIVYVDIEQMDETVAADETFGSVEAVKTVSDLIMPITGEVFEFNEDLGDDPELINSDPFGKGWIVKVKIEEGLDLSALLSVDQYKALVNA